MLTLDVIVFDVSHSQKTKSMSSSCSIKLVSSSKTVKNCKGIYHTLIRIQGILWFLQTFISHLFFFEVFIFVTFISVAFVWYMSCSHGVCVFENFIMGLHDSLLMCPQLSLIVCDDSEFKLVSRLSVLPNGCFWTCTQFNWSVNNNDNNDNRDDDDDDADDNNIYERHNGHYNVNLPVFLSKRGLVKMITKDPKKTLLKMSQQSCTYSKVRVDCEQLSIHESEMLFS